MGVYTLNKKRCCFDIIFLDVQHKWLDDTKTTVELIYYNELGIPTVLTYIHTNDTLEQAKEDKNHYLNIMLNLIRKDVNKSFIEN